MNIKELSNLFYINKELKRLESELEEISVIGATVLDGMPHGTKSGDKVQSLVLKRQTLVEKIVRKQTEYIDEKIRMENFISNIDNPKIRLIVRLRFVEFKSWYDIADEITPEDKELVDRTTPRKYFQRWLKREEMSHMSH